MTESSNVLLASLFLFSEFLLCFKSKLTNLKYRVGRTARLGEKGDSLLFLQPTEIDYLKDLERHGVMLTEYPLLKLLSSFPMYNMKQPASKFVSIEMHPLLIALQRALESFVSAQVCCHLGISYMFENKYHINSQQKSD